MWKWAHTTPSQDSAQVQRFCHVSREDCAGCRLPRGQKAVFLQGAPGLAETLLS